MVHVTCITQLEGTALQQSFLGSTAQQNGSAVGRIFQTMESNCSTYLYKQTNDINSIKQPLTSHSTCSYKGTKR